ncbi:hypothetical protein KSP40_PGU014406 [Platanthera guangdongensis]|uniref:Uncharacterized protein n=1 Tax=Platanthera guangdongensis TaxID=2320717 RepID=A0ABR2MR72_9ASPA
MSCCLRGMLNSGGRGDLILPEAECRKKGDHDQKPRPHLELLSKARRKPQGPKSENGEAICLQPPDAAARSAITLPLAPQNQQPPLFPPPCRQPSKPPPLFSVPAPPRTLNSHFRLSFAIGIAAQPLSLRPRWSPNQIAIQTWVFSPLPTASKPLPARFSHCHPPTPLSATGSSPDHPHYVVKRLITCILTLKCLDQLHGPFSWVWLEYVVDPVCVEPFALATPQHSFAYSTTSYDPGVNIVLESVFNFKLPVPLNYLLEWFGGKVLFIQDLLKWILSQNGEGLDRSRKHTPFPFFLDDFIAAYVGNLDTEQKRDYRWKREGDRWLWEWVPVDIEEGEEIRVNSCVPSLFHVQIPAQQPAILITGAERAWGVPPCRASCGTHSWMLDPVTWPWDPSAEGGGP